MREILFRAKDTHSGAWHYGDLISLRKEGYCGIAEHTLVDNKHLCDITTLGQYTGQTDKNGKKIFEGDIVRCEYANVVKNEHIQIVVFFGGAFMAEFSDGSSWAKLFDGSKHLSCDQSVYMTAIEVIGNIYDNPDLLEGGDDV